MISPSNTSPFLTNTDRDAGGLYQPGYLRAAHNDLFQGALSARFAAEALDVAAVATIDDGDPYTQGLANAMADTFVSLGGDVVLRDEISKGATDMSDALNAIAESGAELVYFPLFAPEAYEAFVETWRQEIDEAGPTGGFHAHGYDAANLLFDAVEAAAEERADGTLVVGKQALRDALAAVEDYEGLTGSLTCQDESPHAGDCATGEALAILQLTAAEVHDGNWPPAVVWSAAMADDGS